MNRLVGERLEKRTRWLVWLESLVIFGLLVWVSLEYENNSYLQSWLASVVGPFGFFLNGTLAALYAGLLLGYAVNEYSKKRAEEERILESIRKKTS